MLESLKVKRLKVNRRVGSAEPATTRFATLPLNLDIGAAVRAKPGDEHLGADIAGIVSRHIRRRR